MKQPLILKNVTIKMWCVLLLLFVSVVMSMDPTTQDLLTPLRQYGENCGYASCPLIKENMINVHIVPHTHGELGYTRTFYQHYTGYDDFYDKSDINIKRILDYTISELWAHRERKFTFSDMPYLFHWWANRDGTVRRMVYELLRQGRLYLVGGGWSMSDEATTSYHAIIDHFTYSLRKINATFLECGRPLVTWQADVFGHSREFVSLMALMGFDGHFISPISFDDELSRMRSKSMEFIWRGNDDLGKETDIFTHKLFDGYWSPPGFCFGTLCNDPLIVTLDSIFKNVDDRVNLFIKSVLHRQSPHYNTSNIMVVMGKRLAYYDAGAWFINIDRLIDLVNAKSYESGAKIHLYYSTPACYLRAVHQAEPTLPTKQDDFLPLAYDKFTHATGFYTSRPTFKYMAREGHVFLQIVKQLQVIARLGNNDKMFEEFMWIMGVFQDHNIITGALRSHVKDYYTEKMYRAVQFSTLLIKKAFNKLRNSPSGTIYYRCSFNISSCTNTNSKQSFVVIYNPLAWPVSIPIRLPIVKARFTVYNHKLEEQNSVVIKIPNAVLKIPNRQTVADHELVFFAENLPPMGYRSYYIELVKRMKRSIIKKLNKNKKKKYLARQTNNLKIDDKSLLDNNEHNDQNYGDYDETTDKSKTRIEFANVTGSNENFEDSYYVLTPKTKMLTTTEAYDTFTDKYNSSVNFEDFDEQYVSILPHETTTTTEKTKTTTKKIILDAIIDKVHKRGAFDYEVSNDMFIRNQYIQINLDTYRKVTNITLSNGFVVLLDIQFYYYASDDPLNLDNPDKKKPGAYIFRPMDAKPVPIIDYIDTVVYKAYLVEEIHCSYADYASFILKLYTGRPVIELDWVIGPIPIKDDIGKDVFIRYATDLVNNGVFYTDSNGRQTIKRIRDSRATYEPTSNDAVSGNYYPVTTKIYIEDLKRNIRFSVFNDRAQGGTSLYDGEIDLMIHRRILTDDSGIQAFLNETEHGEGVIVRGKHYLYVSKADYRPNKVFEKKLAKEIELMPQILVSPTNAYGDGSKDIWVASNNEFSGMTKKLPIGVHVLTIEKWNDGTILLRFENYLEKSDVVKSGIKTVFIKDLFHNITITNVKETTLAANLWLKDWAMLEWKKGEKFVENFNSYYGTNDTIAYSEDVYKEMSEINIDKGITLVPQQIRTFVAWFDYK